MQKGGRANTGSENEALVDASSHQERQQAVVFQRPRSKIRTSGSVQPISRNHPSPPSPHRRSRLKGPNEATATTRFALTIVAPTSARRLRRRLPLLLRLCTGQQQQQRRLLDRSHRTAQDALLRQLPLHYRPAHQRRRRPQRRPLPRPHKPLPRLLRPGLWHRRRREHQGKDHQPHSQHPHHYAHALGLYQHRHHTLRAGAWIMFPPGKWDRGGNKVSIQ